MVRHEAVGPYPDIQLTAPLAQERKVRLVIFIAEERLHAAVAALGDVMSPPRSHYSRQSGHEKSLNHTTAKHKTII